MIKIRRYPGIGCVAVIALCRCRQVIEILAYGSDTVMTAVAGADNLKVVYRYRRLPDTC